MRLGTRPLAARALGDGAYEVRTPVLDAGRHRLVAWLTVRNHRFSVGQHWRSGVFLAHRPPYDSEAT